MTTQEDILMPKDKRRARKVNQANMTYVSQGDDPNNAVLQAKTSPDAIDVQGKGLTPTFGQQQVPNGASLQPNVVPTAAPTPQVQATPQQLVTSKTGVVQVPKATPIPVQDGKVSDMVKDKNLTYKDMYNLLTDQKAEEEKRIKREKQAARIAAIGQGLSSLANLYYTTKGAPSAFTPELSERMRSKYDQLTKDRTANDRAYLQNYITMLERQRADDLAQDRINAQREYNQGMLDYRNQKDAEDRRMKQQDQDFKQGETKRLNDSLIERRENQNANDKTRAEKYGTRSSSSGGSGKKTTWKFKDADGKLHIYDNRAEYDAAVKYYGKKGGISLVEEVESETTSDDGFGNKKTNRNKRQVNKSVSSIAAGMEAKADEKKAAQERNKQVVKRQAKHPI